MERKRQNQQKELATRPKEPRCKGRSARTPVQSDNDISTVKKHVEKPGKNTSSEVDSIRDEHSSNRKTTKKKSQRVQQSKNNPADVTGESNHLPIKSSRKQRVKETSAKGEKYNGTSLESNDKIAQLTANVKYLHNGLNSTTEKKPIKKLNKSKSLDIETNNIAENKSSHTKTMDKQETLGHAKYKSDDDIRESGQCQAKVAPQKKLNKTSKEEKMKKSNSDIGEVTGKDVKTVNSRPPRRLKDVVDGKLRLKMDDIRNAAEKVNKVVDRILKSEQFSKESLFKNIRKMSTGSYYEHVKISKPNEFDIMLEISQESYKSINLTNLDEKSPFYTLGFKDRKPPAMDKYVDQHGNILAQKIMENFRKLIKQIIGEPGMEAVSVQKRDRRSPAVTLIIKNESQDISVDLVLALKIISKWPEQTNNGMNIDDWLGTKVKKDLKRSNFYMVPKQAMNGNKTMDIIDTWRISFSNIEKSILTNHGNGKTCCESKQEMCCRKQCLKLMKYLLDQVKNEGNQRKMDQFCSYHAKTALLHHCAEYSKDEDWKLEDLNLCFDRYVSFFQTCLRNYNLSNFFIPLHNLFSEEYVDKLSCDYLYKKIEKEKINNYPIFNE